MESSLNYPSELLLSVPVLLLLTPLDCARFHLELKFGQQADQQSAQKESLLSILQLDDSDPLNSHPQHHIHFSMVLLYQSYQQLGFPCPSVMNHTH